MKNLPCEEIPPRNGVSRQLDDVRWTMRRVGFFYDNLGVLLHTGLFLRTLLLASLV